MFRLALVVCLAALTSATALADQTAAGAIFRDVERLRNDGQLAAAVTLLRTHLQRQPDDGEATRLLAQTLYWLKDVEAARQVYEAGMVRHPDDTTLRLQYARMLLETRDWAAVPALVEPLVTVPATRAEATGLLGTLAYWQGDLTRARRLFRDTLEANPAHAEARRQLQEIEAGSASWIRWSAAARHDDQPLDRFSGSVEAGWYVTPLVPITIRTQPINYRTGNAASTRLWSTEAAVTGYFPASRLEVDVGGGLLTRPGQATSDGWLGHAGLGVRLAPSVSLRGRVERRPYLNTPESINTPLAVRAVRGAIAVTGARGWLAEASAERQAFPDDNTITTVAAWLLAPLVHRANGDLQAGYAYGYANAATSRFALASPSQRVPPTDPRFDLTGRYVPYFTPDQQHAHAAAVAASMRSVSGRSLTVGGSIPIRATENAPVLTVTNGVVTRTVFERTYLPWTARGALSVPIGSRLAVGLSGEVGRTAFYEWAQGEFQLTYRFLRTRAGQP